MNARHRQAGFSLIEVMCSILILGVALTGLTSGIVTALRSTREAEIRTAAALFAAGLIETLRAEGFYVAGTTDGECGDPLPSANWSRTLSAAELDGLFNVRVTIAHGDTGKTLFELETLLFDPPFSTPSTDTRSSRDADGRRRESRRR